MPTLRHHRRPVAAAILGIAAFVLPASTAAGTEPVHLTIDSPPLTMTLVDMTDEGPSMGDLRVFEAPATTSDGRSGMRWF